jgi:DNA recombination protein RmuC
MRYPPWRLRSVGGCCHSEPMDAAIVAVVGVLGLVAGAAIGFLIGRSSAPTPAGAVDPAAAAQRDAYAGQVQVLVAERDGLAQRLSTAEQNDASARATLEAERAAFQDRQKDLQNAQEQLAQQFEALAARALKSNNDQFLTIAEQRLKQTEVTNAAELKKQQVAVETMVAPIKETLGKVGEQLQALEVERGKAYAELRQQVVDVQRNSEQLKTETASLVKALRAPQARGRWGELQLRRIVELSGMEDRCDFVEQTTTTTSDGETQRPDMVVKLAGGKNVVVDSKVTLAAYIEAHESLDDAYAEERMQAHARHLRNHVTALAGKAYWSQFTPTPEFVVLFVPGEAFLAPALERDASLLEDAMAKKVIIATPTTLISMLKTIAYAWQQEALTDNARAVFDLGRELYDRLGTLGGQMAKLGRSIESVTKDYNTAIGSLESRVLVSARKLNELKVVDVTLDAPPSIETGVRPITKAELLASVESDQAIRLVTDEHLPIEPPAAATGP